MKYPHLISALFATGLVGAFLLGWTRYAVSLEEQYVRVLAPALLPQAVAGSALQRAAFRQTDLLPVLGSSELLQIDSPYRAVNFFQDYPTGFNIFVIARGGVTPLLMAQDLAAIGPDLRGKKVVISLTPLVFYHPEVYPDAYAGNFSRLHADELAFSPYLSYRVKRLAAVRMLQYPDTLAKDSLLRFALERLVDGKPISAILYGAAYPLGRLEILRVRLQDHWEVVNWIWQHPGLAPSVPRHPAPPDWVALASKAQEEDTSASASNPYGVEDGIWFATHKAWVDQHLPPASRDVDYLEHLQETQEWNDLDIMLETLKEFGAQPLILGLPAKGTLMDALGVSYGARLVYYSALQDTLAVYGIPLVDYQKYDGDNYFLIDLFSHLSRKGWVYVDRTLDAFYHDTLR